MTCGKCNYDKAYFREVQTRSADEAATLFFTCVKCGCVGIACAGCALTNSELTMAPVQGLLQSITWLLSCFAGTAGRVSPILIDGGCVKMLQMLVCTESAAADSLTCGIRSSQTPNLTGPYSVDRAMTGILSVLVMPRCYFVTWSFLVVVHSLHVQHAAQVRRFMSQTV